MSVINIAYVNRYFNVNFGFYLQVLNDGNRSVMLYLALKMKSLETNNDI